MSTRLSLGLMLLVGFCACGSSVESDESTTSNPEALSQEWLNLGEVAFEAKKADHVQTTVDLSGDGTIDTVFLRTTVEAGGLKLIIKTNVDATLAAIEQRIRTVARHEIPQIKALDLSGSDITSAGIKRIAYWGSLEELNLAKCEHLTRLKRNGVESTKSSKPSNQTWASVRWLDLSGSDVTETVLTNFSNMPRLRAVGLSNNQRLQRFSKLQLKWPSVAVLDIHSTGVQDPLLNSFMDLLSLNVVILSHRESPLGVLYLNGPDVDFNQLESIYLAVHNVYTVRAPSLYNVFAFLTQDETWIQSKVPIYTMHPAKGVGLVRHLVQNRDPILESQTTGTCTIL